MLYEGKIKSFKYREVIQIDLFFESDYKVGGRIRGRNIRGGYCNGLDKS